LPLTSATHASANALFPLPGQTLHQSMWFFMSSVVSTNWQQLAQHLAFTGHRRMVLVEGEPEWARAWVVARLEAFEAAEVLWVGDAGRAGVRGIASKEYRRWLGQETGVLVWDGWL